MDAIQIVGWRVDQTAQAERQLPDLGGHSDGFALLRRHLQRCGMRDERLTVFAVELLIDADYPHIVQHGLRSLVFWFRIAISDGRQLMGDQDVDSIAGKDKP